MAVYHITKSDNIERCVNYSSCVISKILHFESLSEAIQHLDKNICLSILNSSGETKVKRYDGEINYNSGKTIHYKGNRIFREIELTNLLGKGKKVKTFIVEKDANNIQIQELLDNAVLNVYSFHTHKKITLFAPRPERIISLYTSIGEFPPEWLIEKSESNARKGYNEIFL